jgi:hypothetical protein
MIPNNSTTMGKDYFFIRSSLVILPDKTSIVQRRRDRKTARERTGEIQKDRRRSRLGKQCVRKKEMVRK